MKFAILMITYNGEKYIKEQLESIFRQDYSEWHLFINDDGSSDATKKVIMRSCKEFNVEDKVTLFDNKSKYHGYANNMFDLLNKVPNDYQLYTFCDQDDVWPLNRLRITQDYYRNINNSEIPSVIIGKLSLINAYGDELKRVLSQERKGISIDQVSYKELLLDPPNILGCAMTFNQSLKKLIRPNFNKIYYHDRFILWLASCFGDVHLLDEIVIFYRQHGDNASGEVCENILFDLAYRLKNCKGVINRIKILRNKEVDELISLFRLYYKKLTVSQRKYLEELIKALLGKSRVKSLILCKKNAYISGFVRKYMLIIFLVKGKVRG